MIRGKFRGAIFRRVFGDAHMCRGQVEIAEYPICARSPAEGFAVRLSIDNPINNRATVAYLGGALRDLVFVATGDSIVIMNNHNDFRRALLACHESDARPARHIKSDVVIVAGAVRPVLVYPFPRPGYGKSNCGSSQIQALT